MVKTNMMAAKNTKGFTLIELMIAIAVLGILLAIAIPNYNEYVTKARRTDAQAHMMQMQLGLEKWRANNASYRSDATATSAGTATTNTPANAGFTGTNPYYTYTIINTTGTTYTINAAATAQGGQATKDAACTPLTLNQSGVKTPANCWKR